MDARENKASSEYKQYLWKFWNNKSWSNVSFDFRILWRDSERFAHIHAILYEKMCAQLRIFLDHPIQSFCYKNHTGYGVARIRQIVIENPVAHFIFLTTRSRFPKYHVFRKRKRRRNMKEVRWRTQQSTNPRQDKNDCWEGSTFWFIRKLQHIFLSVHILRVNRIAGAYITRYHIICSFRI